MLQGLQYQRKCSLSIFISFDKSCMRHEDFRLPAELCPSSGSSINKTKIKEFVSSFFGQQKFFNIFGFFEEKELFEIFFIFLKFFLDSLRFLDFFWIFSIFMIFLG